MFKAVGSWLEAAVITTVLPRSDSSTEFVFARQLMAGDRWQSRMAAGRIHSNCNRDSSDLNKLKMQLVHDQHYLVPLPLQHVQSQNRQVLPGSGHPAKSTSLKTKPAFQDRPGQLALTHCPPIDPGGPP